MVWPWKLKKDKLRWLKTLLIGLVVLAASAVVLHFASRSHPTSPDQAALQATSQLATTLDKLSQSFNEPQTDPGRNAKQYIGYMDSITAECHDISQANKDGQTRLQTNAQASSNAAVQLATLERLNASNKLCSDLSKIAGNSMIIYKSLLPLLTISPTLKLYQTLPLIKSNLRDHQLATVAEASDQLNKQTASITFPTAAPALLKQLLFDMHKSRGLSYLPGLRSVQYQLVAERHAYWTDYIGLALLQQSLQKQLTGYCQTAAQSARLDACVTQH